MTHCPRCHRSTNVATCCGRATMIDEHFPTEKSEEHVYSIRRHRLLMKRADRRKRFGPLDTDNLDRIAEHLDRAIEWTRESRDEHAKALRAVLKDARGKLFTTRVGRKAI